MNLPELCSVCVIVNINVLNFYSHKKTLNAIWISKSKPVWILIKFKFRISNTLLFKFLNAKRIPPYIKNLIKSHVLQDKQFRNSCRLHSRRQKDKQVSIPPPETVCTSEDEKNSTHVKHIKPFRFKLTTWTRLITVF